MAAAATLLFDMYRVELHHHFSLTSKDKLIVNTFLDRRQLFDYPKDDLTDAFLFCCLEETDLQIHFAQDHLCDQKQDTFL